MTRNRIPLLSIVALMVLLGCQREEFDLEPAKFPSTAEVFIDGFSAGLEYAAFGDSKLTAFDVDTDVTFEGTASMRFDVPNFGDPEGPYAGGVFRDLGGRDLTGYDALTFWAKASTGGTVDLVGFGTDFMENKYSTSMSISVGTSWNKFIIPIPDPSKLVQEKGLFGFAEGPEDGKGYTIWIDEVKFEKLGTIAQPRPAIMGGTNVTQQAFNGLDLSVSGLTQTFNLPNGNDQTVSAAPAYFEFNSSFPEVATVDEFGKISVATQGTTRITAVLAGVDAKGSLTVESLGDLETAPTPTRNAEDVISIFSDAYDNIPVDFYNGYFAPFQTTQGQNDLNINGDNIIRYSQLNFVATQFANPTLNASEMTHLHLDIHVVDPLVPTDYLKIEVVDFGANAAFGGNDDTSGTVQLAASDLQSKAWVGIDIPLADFGGLASRTNLAQILIISDATISSILVDNIYFFKGEVTGGSEPEVGAPVPPARDAGDVISIFSDAYTDITGIDRNPDWGQSTQVSEVDIAGNNTLLYSSFNYQGTDFSGNAQDVSNMEFLHIDMWTANATDVKVTPINPNSTPIEFLSGLTPVTAEEWVSYDIPLSVFTNEGMTLENIIQLKFDGQGGISPSKIYLDNIYFYKEGSGNNGPTSAAPAPPVRDAAQVISIYSDTYTDVSGINRNPDWGQSTQVSEVQIEGNNTLLYADFNYQGTDFSGNAQDASGMQMLHIDMWTADATDVKVTPINPTSTPAEFLVGLTPITPGQWVSYDIPLTDFINQGMTLDNIIQMKFDGQGGTTPSTIYLDNIYFYSEELPTEPTTAAPVPPARDAADVVSIFSNAYTEITGINRNPDWGQSTQVSEVDIDGNNTLLYSDFNYQGTDFSGNSQDISAMQFLHIDMWTVDATDVKVTPINPTSTPAEFLVGITPITAGQWVSYNIPLSEFTSAGMTLDNVVQMKFDGQAGTTPSTIYLDNIYFFKSATGANGELTINGDFETGDLTGWTSFATENNGSFTATDAESIGGTFSGLIVADVNGIGSPSFPVVKQANIGIGTVTPGVEIEISFDLFGSVEGAGGVVFAEFFSELGEGGTSKAEILGGGPIFPTSSWTTHSFTTTAGADVSGGVTLQLKADCGGNAGCKVSAYFDNVSVKIKE